MALLKSLFKTFLHSFQFCRIKHILHIAVDLQTVLIVQALFRCVSRYLSLLKKTGEDSFLQSCRTLHQP